MAYIVGGSISQYKAALFIGRFQPLHKGHVWEMEQALYLADQLIVGIGSSNVSDKNNPWTAKQRRQMVEKVIENKGWGERVLDIWELPDTTDEKWVEAIKLKAKSLKLKAKDVLVLGNNVWVTELLGAAGFPVYVSGFYNRAEWEGVKVRQLKKVGDLTWRERVPSYLLELVE